MGKDESKFKVMALERTNFLFALQGSTFGFQANSYAGAHINIVGGLYIEPMMGVGFTLFISKEENKSEFDVTGGGLLNIGYGFGEGQNIFCYAGCEVQYAAFFFKRLFYSAHAGVGVRF